MIIQSKNVLIDDNFTSAQVEIKNKTITEIYSYGEKVADIDYTDKYLVPGFYDVHCHGYKGFDTNDGGEKGLVTWAKEIVREGVCGFCPTTITQSSEVLEKALKNVYEVSKTCYEGARILGVHFEGPYLEKTLKGAQPEEYIVKPDIEEFKEYVDISHGMIKIITLACEHDEEFKLIKYCSANGINVSLGHSGASYDCARSALEYGAKSFTHTFNGMHKFNHHTANLLDASLLSDDAFSEIIADGNHTTIEALKIFFRCKPHNKVLLVSDALKAKGLKAGEVLEFGGQKIEIQESGVCTLYGTNTLAGSTLKINEGIKLLVNKVGISLVDAVKMASTNPSTYLKLSKGCIKKGFDADLVILNNDFEVLMTMVEGCICYKSDIYSN
ncbi:MAG: N-acetylglucosamine-6-phosphate deacetylase [Lachnospiraceae bacterium]|nr:N-acetylglucosamine-6-phosphate deacetylase [Lachnospiraceae bacterium]